MRNSLKIKNWKHWKHLKVASTGCYVQVTCWNMGDHGDEPEAHLRAAAAAGPGTHVTSLRCKDRWKAGTQRELSGDRDVMILKQGVGLGIPQGGTKTKGYTVMEKRKVLWREQLVSRVERTYFLVQNKALNVSPCCNSLKLFSMMDYFIRYIT